MVVWAEEIAQLKFLVTIQLVPSSRLCVAAKLVSLAMLVKSNVQDIVDLSAVETVNAIVQPVLATVTMAGQVPLAIFSAAAILPTENAILLFATPKLELLLQLVTIASATETSLDSAPTAPVELKALYANLLAFMEELYVKAANVINTGLLLPAMFLALSPSQILQQTRYVISNIPNS